MRVCLFRNGVVAVEECLGSLKVRDESLFGNGVAGEERSIWLTNLYSLSECT